MMLLSEWWLLTINQWCTPNLQGQQSRDGACTEVETVTPLL